MTFFVSDSNHNVGEAMKQFTADRSSVWLTAEVEEGNPILSLDVLSTGK